LESPEQLCVGNTKISINIKTNLKENWRYDWIVLFPKIRKDKREDRCRIGKRVTIWEYGLDVPGNN
jgi:hypothetical protein